MKLTAGIIFIFLSLLINFISHHFYLYWQTGWIDSIAHFFGGLGAVFIFLWSYKRADLLLSLIFIFLVGLAWEIYEYKAGIVIYTGSLSYWTDTLSDIFWDLIGGSLAYLLTHEINFLRRS